MFENARRISGLDVALLVEYRVIGQRALQVGGNDFAVANHRSRVVTLAAGLVRMTQHQSNAADFRDQPLEHPVAGLKKIIPQ